MLVMITLGLDKCLQFQANLLSLAIEGARRFIDFRLLMIVEKHDGIPAQGH